MPPHVHLPDHGAGEPPTQIGISQGLPVLVHAHADRGQIVAREQPEIILHAELQTELGDVFIHSALGEQKNTFLLETHSEHLILRVMRRIRQTKEAKLPQGFTANNAGGEGTLSRLWEQAGDSGARTVQLPSAMKARTAQPCNLRGEPAGPPLAISERGTFKITTQPMTPVTVFLRGIEQP